MKTASAMQTFDGADRTTLGLYLNDIKRYPLLSRAEQDELARRARDGDVQAREKLIRCNLRFVVSIAKKYAGNGVPLEDLVNEGNLGLLRAADRFDPDRGYKFISYAVWWVRQAILHSLSEAPRMVRLPMNRVGLAQRATRTARKLEQDLGRDPYAEEIARELSVSEREVEEVMSFSRGHVSLDEPLSADGEDAFIDQIQDEEAESPDQNLFAQMLSRDLRRALLHLTEREQTILNMYYGLDGEEPLTLEEIGRRLGYTRERIRQVKGQAIEKLRNRPRAQEIAEYLCA
ncbi:MAG: RNA polymerase sigma factor RpoD/SigA [Candidatus Krumholzibacteria bacterium]|nr:RNA polymerase sigma factor RpoD/SigA [Candidatus Krumholzibacteria bacterium]MDH4336752.1 RNA polymerase sigma factor RpoD/SigA [Candidatus Krumholzibacteria bacterium]